jgi:hypothetical protein
VGGKRGGGGRGEKWPKPCMHIWIIKEKKKNLRFSLPETLPSSHSTKYLAFVLYMKLKHSAQCSRGCDGVRVLVLRQLQLTSSTTELYCELHMGLREIGISAIWTVTWGTNQLHSKALQSLRCSVKTGRCQCGILILYYCGDFVTLFCLSSLSGINWHLTLCVFFLPCG